MKPHHEFDAPLYGDGRKVKECAQFYDAIREFHADVVEVGELEKGLEACTFEAWREKAPAILARHGRLAEKWEGKLPRYCGECEACYERQGGCPCGWSNPRMCPKCRGAE